MVFHDDHRHIRAGRAFRPESGADRPRLGFDVGADAISLQSGGNRNRYVGAARRGDDGARDLDLLLAKLKVEMA